VKTVKTTTKESKIPETYVIAAAISVLVLLIPEIRSFRVGPLEVETATLETSNEPLPL